MSSSPISISIPSYYPSFQGLEKVYLFDARRVATNFESFAVELPSRFRPGILYGRDEAEENHRLEAIRDAIFSPLFPKPGPDPREEFARRQHGDLFAVRVDSSESLTTFVHVSGFQHEVEWAPGGCFHQKTKGCGITSLAVLPPAGNDPTNHRDVILTFTDLFEADHFLNIMRTDCSDVWVSETDPIHPRLRAYCLTAAQYCNLASRFTDAYGTGSDGKPKRPVPGLADLHPTHSSGYDGQLLVEAILDHDDYEYPTIANTLSPEDLYGYYKNALVRFATEMDWSIFATKAIRNDAAPFLGNLVIELANPEQVTDVTDYFKAHPQGVVRHIAGIPIRLYMSEYVGRNTVCKLAPPPGPRRGAAPSPPTKSGHQSNDQRKNTVAPEQHRSTPSKLNGAAKEFGYNPSRQTSMNGRLRQGVVDETTYKYNGHARKSTDGSDPSDSYSTADHQFREPRVFWMTDADRKYEPRASRFTGFGDAHATKHGFFGGRHFSAHAGNNIDVFAIRAGLEHRSTVMLRNVPSDLSTDMFESMIFEFAPGRSTFIYLRKDFSSSKNVGYGFVDFTDPSVVILFMEEVVGNFWPGSKKRIEMSYATFQGREALVERFRNSVVMMEPNEHRPRLYYTNPSPYAGMQMEFPASDNRMKLCRSIHSAADQATGGLYVNGHGRARRTGNFDHGNPRNNNYDEMMAKLQTLQIENDNLNLKLRGQGNHANRNMKSHGSHTDGSNTVHDFIGSSSSKGWTQEDEDFLMGRKQKLVIKARGVGHTPMYRHRMATS